jgi:hypothetical protein
MDLISHRKMRNQPLNILTSGQLTKATQFGLRLEDLNFVRLLCGVLCQSMAELSRYPPLSKTRMTSSTSVIGPIPSRLKCSICERLAQDPHRLPCCEKSICGTCIPRTNIPKHQAYAPSQQPVPSATTVPSTAKTVLKTSHSERRSRSSSVTPKKKLHIQPQ